MQSFQGNSRPSHHTVMAAVRQRRERGALRVDEDTGFRACSPHDWSARLPSHRRNAKCLEQSRHLGNGGLRRAGISALGNDCHA